MVCGLWFEVGGWWFEVGGWCFEVCGLWFDSSGFTPHLSHSQIRQMRKLIDVATTNRYRLPRIDTRTRIPLVPIHNSRLSLCPQQKHPQVKLSLAGQQHGVGDVLLHNFVGFGNGRERARAGGGGGFDGCSR